MPKVSHEELLKDPRVIEEIHRHLWIESEKAGYDIGFERAAQDWLTKYAAEWMKYHMPEKKRSARRILSPKKKTSKAKSGK